MHEPSREFPAPDVSKIQTHQPYRLSVYRGGLANVSSRCTVVRFIDNLPLPQVSTDLSRSHVSQMATDLDEQAEDFVARQSGTCHVRGKPMHWHSRSVRAVARSTGNLGAGRVNAERYREIVGLHVTSAEPARLAGVPV
jgi:hypothetical protein